MWKQNLLLGAALVSANTMADVRYADAPVRSVEPIVETVSYVEPKERCWFEDVPVSTVSHSATTPLLGALIGGAIGNAVGHKKRNKQVGAVVGALIGGSIAADISREEGRHRVASSRRARREVCEVVDETSYRREVTGYLVTYEYAGQTYQSRMRKRPGDYVRVRVTVGPA
ncbi:MAG: glycine zipper 2TM domain-containing protein [Gammaproteobacteria bacterium]|nr:glycine zipper 2TM domain-containing protein [Gammaproteobacteria bacterium]